MTHLLRTLTAPLVRLARFLSIGELYLMVSAAGAVAIAFALLVLPDRLTTGPSVATLYAIADRETWGMVYAVVALVCALGAWRPSELRFIGALTLVVLIQTAWAVGLSLPSLGAGAVTNLLMPVAWLQLAVTGVLIGIVGHRPVLPACPPRASPTRG